MSNYLPPGHPDEYKDIRVRSPKPQFGMTVKCLACKGHGCRNLVIDYYAKDCHLQTLCAQCGGTGWVQPGSKNATCRHQWEHVSSTPQGRHEDKCSLCGKLLVTDSGD